MVKHLVLGNWKSNGTRAGLNDFGASFEHPPAAKDLAYGISIPHHLLLSAQAITPMWLGAENVSSFSEGAYTGEISAKMLRECACHFCLVGHSERRQLLGESIEATATKLKRLLETDILPIFCIGETLAEREAGRLTSILTRQLAPLNDLPSEASFAVAYEPVWAIGTGVAAGPDDVRGAHGLIKGLLAEAGFGETPVLYGGSVKPANARALAEIPRVDGFLIGGASLAAEDFSAILSQYIAGKQL